MKTLLEQYQAIVDELRERRRAAGPQGERALIAQLEDLYDELSPEDRAVVESEGWRSWPDLYDARMES